MKTIKKISADLREVIKEAQEKVLPSGDKKTEENPEAQNLLTKEQED